MVDAGALVFTSSEDTPFGLFELAPENVGALLIEKGLG